MCPLFTAEDTNVFVDYTGAYEDGEALEDKTGGRLSLNKFFFDDRWLIDYVNKIKFVTCASVSVAEPLVGSSREPEPPF